MNSAPTAASCYSWLVQHSSHLQDQSRLRATDLPPRFSGTSNSRDDHRCLGLLIIAFDRFANLYKVQLRADSVLSEMTLVLEGHGSLQLSGFKSDKNICLNDVFAKVPNVPYALSYGCLKYGAFPPFVLLSTNSPQYLLSRFLPIPP